jgi:hypothetical protein
MKSYIKAGGSSKIGQYIKAFASVPAFDPDAQAFFTASGLTGATELNAVNQLVLDMKSYGIWSKMKAIYPFVGGTAALHKWNLKNPLDTNAAFRLVFSGGWTHSVNGALPNGTNGYASTFLFPNLLLANSKHLSYYSRTSNTTVGFSSSIGSDNSSDGYCRFTIRQTNGANINSSSSLFGNNVNGIVSYTNTDGTGFYNSVRLNTDHKFFKNAVSVGTLSALGTTSQSIREIVIGAAKSGGVYTYYDNKQCAFASIGDGLTDTEAGNFYTAVQNFNTSLSRQV